MEIASPLAVRASSKDVDNNILNYFDKWRERSTKAWDGLMALYNPAVTEQVVPSLLPQIARGNAGAKRMLQSIFDADLDVLSWSVRIGDAAAEPEPYLLSGVHTLAGNDVVGPMLQFLETVKNGGDNNAINIAEAGFRNAASARFEDLLDKAAAGSKEATEEVQNLMKLDLLKVGKEAIRNNYGGFHSLQTLIEEAPALARRRAAIEYTWDHHPETARTRGLLLGNERELIMDFRAERDESCKLWPGGHEAIAMVAEAGGVNFIDTDARFEDLAERLFLAGVQLDQIDGVVCKRDVKGVDPVRNPPLDGDSAMSRFRRALFDKCYGFTDDSKGTQARADLGIAMWKSHGLEPHEVAHSGDSYKDGIHAKLAGAHYLMNVKGADVEPATTRLMNIVKPTYPLGLEIANQKLAEAGVEVGRYLVNGMEDFPKAVTIMPRPPAPGAKRSVKADIAPNSPSPV